MLGAATPRAWRTCRHPSAMDGHGAAPTAPRTSRRGPGASPQPPARVRAEPTKFTVGASAFSTLIQRSAGASVT